MLRRDFHADAPNQRWVADITEFPTGNGKLYLAAVRDLHHRGIVGWDTAGRQDAALVVSALTMALARTGHPAKVIHHADKGTQYTSIAYTERLADIGAAPSIGTIGDSFDNAMAETTIGLFKTELHRHPAALARNGGPWRGLDDLELAVCEWVSWFNTERLHSELGDKTPTEIEHDYRHPSQPEAA